jgi:hypothetical protein
MHPQSRLQLVVELARCWADIHSFSWADIHSWSLVEAEPTKDETTAAAGGLGGGNAVGCCCCVTVRTKRERGEWFGLLFLELTSGLVAFRVCWWEGYVARSLPGCTGSPQSWSRPWPPELQCCNVVCLGSLCFGCCKECVYINLVVE